MSVMECKTIDILQKDLKNLKKTMLITLRLIVLGIIMDNISSDMTSHLLLSK